MRKRQSTHKKRTTKPRVEQGSLYVVALLFVGALAVYLASHDQLNANAVSVLGAVTTALVVLIKTSKK
jgi:cellobiose-specific phosphotransferase system component IIC